MSKDIPGSHQADVHSTSAEGFNARELRNALGSFATGVTIVTTRSRDGKAFLWDLTPESRAVAELALLGQLLNSRQIDSSAAPRSPG